VRLSLNKVHLILHLFMISAMMPFVIDLVQQQIF